MSNHLPQAPSAEAVLAAHGPAWWRQWDAAALRAACAGVPDDQLQQRPNVARWRALAALMQEGADALDCLERAFDGHLDRGDTALAALDARIALVLCLIDGGTMRSVGPWLLRAAATPLAADAQPAAPFWAHAGTVAMAVFGGQDADADGDTQAAPAAARWLRGQLAPLQQALSPNERLIAAQVLINWQLGAGEFAQFDVLANAVEEPALFDLAAPLMRGRWLHTLGLAHYHIGNFERATQTWQRALALAEAQQLAHLRLLTSLATLRLLIDRGRIAEAAALRATLQPNWGGGRHVQLMYLRQMDARLLLLQEQPARALVSIEDALALAAELGLSASEQASCLTDLGQILVANQRLDAAVALLQRAAASLSGRDATVFSCLLDLLQGWRQRTDQPDASRTLLASGLQKATAIRYTMFFRLLPRLAGEICSDALRWDIEPVLIGEIVRARDLPAPAGAGASWPWALWLQLFGPFDVRLRGSLLSSVPRRKSPKKPMELLQLLGCAPGMSLALADAADALWPEADGDLARKSLDMAIQRLRRLLDDDDSQWVVVADGRIALSARHVSSDWAQRRDLVAALENAAAQQDGAARCLPALRAIVALTAGPLLANTRDAPWCAPTLKLARADNDRVARALAACQASPALDLRDRSSLAALSEELVRRSP